MVSHRGLKTIYFTSCIVGIWATWVQKLKQAKNDKFEFFSYCNQIHNQIGYMSPFVHIICNSSYCYHTEASWPFISKVKAAWVHKLESKQKSKILSFFFMIVTKYINTLPDSLSGSICSHYMYFIILVSHRCLMTIYFKSRGSWLQLGCING